MNKESSGKAPRSTTGPEPSTPHARPARWEFPAALAVMLVGTHWICGTGLTLFQDDWWLVSGPNTFVRPGEKADEVPVGETLGRIRDACGIARFPSHAVFHVAFPRLADHFWIVHVWLLANHLLNGRLIFALVRRAAGSDDPAWAAAALFLLWPLAGEVVFWASAFHYQVSLTLVLAAALVWLRAEPWRGGFLRGLLRAWPAPVLCFLGGLFEEQALTACGAVPLLTLLRWDEPGAAATAGDAPRSPVHPPEPPLVEGRNETPVLKVVKPVGRLSPGRVLGRLLGHGLFFALPILVWMPPYFLLHDGAAMAGEDGRVMPGRYVRPTLEQLPRRLGQSLQHMTRQLPLLPYHRRQCIGATERLPRTAGDHPIAAAFWLAGSIGLGWALLRRRPRPGDPVPALPPAGGVAGLLLFAAGFWTFAWVPFLGTMEEWWPLRLGWYGTVGPVVALGVGMWWTGRMLAGMPAADAGGRVLFAAWLSWTGAACMVDGAQYLRQERFERAHVSQMRDAVGPPAGRRVFLAVFNTTQHGQNLSLARQDHISVSWAYPWVARAKLQRAFPDRDVRDATPTWHLHPAGDLVFMAAGFSNYTLQPQELLDNWADAVIFSFPTQPADSWGMRDIEELVPAAAVQFETRKGQVLGTFWVPRMLPLVDDSDEPMHVVRLRLPWLQDLRFPASMEKHRLVRPPVVLHGR